MNKSDLLKHIAAAGYNVGFGAKKSFATYDIVSKIPGWIGFVSLIVSVFGLYIDGLSSKHISAFFIFLSIGGILINFYDVDKDKYERAGVTQTKIFREIEALYFSAKDEQNPDSDRYRSRLKALMSEFYDSSVSKQIFGSNWYAHYKFFSEFEKRWVEHELGLTFWRDKFPNTLKIAIILLAVVLIYFGFV
ncbi:SLATT domain-containing protein [Serratia marcescens]|nr:SLATT domain-containing protein [Serratia marcescens]ELQ9442352.1 SLATT domain-containing protein [Serratia marcescens]ELT5563112.1 SLATT domain-containing protein [Serratia marcescens]